MARKVFALGKSLAELGEILLKEYRGCKVIGDAPVVRPLKVKNPQVSLEIPEIEEEISAGSIPGETSVVSGSKFL